ncbi:MAG: hypothetical protein K0R03_1296 [Moraxellaceae bacterium]|jgi:hypothetical protein|nr:hypothetical protein [Moraxellaceae bacterium]
MNHRPNFPWLLPALPLLWMLAAMLFLVSVSHWATP